MWVSISQKCLSHQFRLFLADALSSCSAIANSSSSTKYYTLEQIKYLCIYPTLILLLKRKNLNLHNMNNTDFQLKTSALKINQTNIRFLYKKFNNINDLQINHSWAGTV